MSLPLRPLLCLATLVLAACDQGTPPPPISANTASWDISDIAPSDFALIGCPSARQDDNCLIIAAGGKRVLLGTPALGIEGLEGDLLAGLDAVLVFSLRAEDLSGLAIYRNSSWRAGRRQSALIYGPAGIDRVVDGINMAYETADAITYLEDPPAGDFTDALLISRSSIAAPDPAFDTGDLLVSAIAIDNTDITYQIDYESISVRITRCGTAAPQEQTVLTIEACAANWPANPYFLIRNS